MGYNTSYELSVDKEGIDINMMADKLFDILKMSLDPSDNYYGESLKYIRQMVDQLIYDDRYDGRWYNHTKDMKQLSLEFPGYKFRLQGQGEESNDRWIAYYLSGKSVEYTKDSFINWIVHKYHGDRNQLFDEYIDSNMK